MKTKFPDKFFWGAATAAHQIEEDLSNDWTNWENENAHHRAVMAEKEYRRQADVLGEFPEEYWNSIKEKAAKLENYISGKAIKHRELYKEDLKFLKKLNLNAYRFSIEWSKVEPKQSEFDQKEIAYYKEYIREIKAQGAEPFVTLWHFTSPKWFSDLGGWEKKSNIKYFLNFVERITKEIKDQVKYWTVLNEPVGYTVSGYLVGVFPPAKKNLFRGVRVFNNFAKAHNEAYKLIKSIDPGSIVGIANNYTHFSNYKKNFILRPLTGFLNYVYNQRFSNKIKNNLDFIGVNFYVTLYMDLLIKKKLGGKFEKPHHTSDMGWYLNPEGFYKILKRQAKYGKPIIITEHGLADESDLKRFDYIYESLKIILRCIEEGIDIRGYIHWSLFDNFEWDKGYWPQFGLISVDYKDYGRKIKKSGEYYARIAAANELLKPQT